MKIMHVLTDSNIGGAGILVESLLRHTAVPHENITVLLPRGAALAARFRAHGVRVFDVLHTPDSSLSLRDFLTVRRMLLRLRPDILHTHASLSAKLAARTLLFLRPTVLGTRHCAYPAWRGGRPFFRVLHRLVDRALSSVTVATAEAAVRNLVALGLPQKRIRLIRNGGEELTPLSAHEKDALRDALLIPRNAFVVGMCARMVPAKDHMTMLRAAKLLLSAKVPLSEHTGYHFLWIGDGSEAPTLRLTAEKWGLSAHLTMVGEVSDVSPYLNLFDLSVNCSIGTETSSLALSEGMSLGIPAVVSRYGGNPEMIGEGENGLLFPPQDAHALAAAIARIAADPPLYRRLSEGARTRYFRDLRAAKMAREYDCLYEKLLLARRRPLLARRPAQEH